MFLFRKNPSAIILIIFFSFIFLFFLHSIEGDGDFFHHASTGKYILTHYSIPHIDEYTFTANGRPWVANAWGTGVLYYILYSINPIAISFFTGLVAVLFFVLVYFWLKTYSIKPWLILLLISFCAPIIAIRFSNRPETLTYPFLAALFLIDAYFKQKPKILFLLPVIFLFWSMLYVGSIFVGLGFLSLFFIRRLIQNRFIFNKPIVVYGSCVALSFLATIFNGNGLEGLAYILKIPVIAKTSGEWLGIFPLLQQVQTVPLLLLQYRVLLYFIYFCVFFVILLLCLFIKRDILKKNIFLFIISLGIFAPFFAIRNIPLAILLSLPLFGIMLSQVVKRFKTYAVALLITLACLSISLSYWINPIGVGQDKKTFSPDVISFLRNHNINGNVFAEQQMSSYVTFELFPKVLIFADTRDDLYLGTSILSMHNDLFYYGGNVMPLLSKYNVKTVIADATSRTPFDALLYSPDWKLVFVNDSYYILMKKDKERESIPSFSGIDLANTKGAKLKNEEIALREYERLLKQYPNAFNIRYAAAKLHLAMQDPMGAIFHAEQLQIQGGPFYPFYASQRDSILSVSYLLTKQCVKAKEALDALHNDVTGKFIFDNTKRLPSTGEEGYMYYYLTCEPDYSKANGHLQNVINDAFLSNAEKQHAKNIFLHFTESK